MDTPVAGSSSSNRLHRDPNNKVAARGGFEASTCILETSVASSLYARVLWLQDFNNKYFPSLPSKADIQGLPFFADIRKMASVVVFVIFVATADTLQYAARSVAARVTISCSKWLRNWDIDITSHARVHSQSLQGGKLFGEAMHPLSLESRGKKVLTSVSHQRDTPSHHQQPFHVPRHHSARASTSSGAPTSHQSPPQDNLQASSPAAPLAQPIGAQITKTPFHPRPHQSEESSSGLQTGGTK